MQRQHPGSVVSSVRVLFVTWLLALLVTAGHCYFFETPRSASPFLMLLLVADVLLTIALGAAGIGLSIKRRRFRYASLSVSAVVGILLLLVVLGPIERERRSLALGVVKHELAQREPNAGAVTSVISFKAEVYTLFFLVRTESGRVYSAQLSEDGRTFTLQELSEVSDGEHKRHVYP